MLPARQQLDFIDAFRGWAILGVLLVHSALITTPPTWLQPLTEYGARGVQLFYLVSAFTLFYALDQRRDKADQHPVIAFFIRRFFRIAPLFYITFILSLIVSGLGARYWAPNGVSLTNIITTLFFVNGWHPEWINAIVFGGWSIAIEMNFYLLVPILYRFIKKLWVAVLCVPIAFIGGHAIANLIAAYYAPYYPAEQQYLVDSWQHLLSLPNELYVFMCGIALYFLWRDHRHLFDRIPPVFHEIGFYALTIILIASFYVLPSTPLIVCLFAALVLLGSTVRSPLVTSRPIRFLGQISYSLYLLHFFVYSALEKLVFNTHSTGFAPWFATLGLELFIAVPLAYVSYRLIEKPGQILGAKLIKHKFAA